MSPKDPGAWNESTSEDAVKERFPAEDNRSRQEPRLAARTVMTAVQLQTLVHFYYRQEMPNHVALRAIEDHVAWFVSLGVMSRVAGTPELTRKGLAWVMAILATPMPEAREVFVDLRTGEAIPDK